MFLQIKDTRPLNVESEAQRWFKKYRQEKTMKYQTPKWLIRLIGVAVFIIGAALTHSYLGINSTYLADFSLKEAIDSYLDEFQNVEYLHSLALRLAAPILLIIAFKLVDQVFDCVRIASSKIRRGAKFVPKFVKAI